MILVVRSTRSLRGTLTVPGDKSISHRAFLLGALTHGTTRIFGCLKSEDVQSTLRAIRALGVRVRPSTSSGRTVDLVIEGRGFEGLKAPAGPLDMGNSGTTTRLLVGILAGRPFSATLFGDESLSQRPMRRVTEPLSKMGAKFEMASGPTAPRHDAYLPLTVRGGRLRGIRYEMPVSSAQVKSALLLAGLQAEGSTTVVEPVPTRDHTERMLRYMGAKIEIASAPAPACRPGRGPRNDPRGAGPRNDVIASGAKQSRITIWPGPLEAREIRVPGDFSSAAFFFAAAAMVPGSSVTVRGVGLNPTRTAFLELLKRMGAKVEISRMTGGEWEPVGDVTVSHAPLKAVTVEPELVPNVIDELPVLMVAATQAEGVTRLRGVEELRVKETDRIRSMVTNLSVLGARIHEEKDGVTIEGPVQLRGGRVDSFGDHRTALAMAVAGLAAEGKTEVQGSEWIRISFSQFEPLLESLRRD